MLLSEKAANGTMLLMMLPDTAGLTLTAKSDKLLA
jgi:hypothetical protein